jgi:hypothetical protein
MAGRIGGDFLTIGALRCDKSAEEGAQRARVARERRGYLRGELGKG